MATTENIKNQTYIAGADLSSSQHLFVKVSGAGVVLAGDGDEAAGVLQNSPISGEAASVAVSGMVKVVAGGTIAVGAKVGADAAGKAVTAASGDIELGIAREAAVANQVISMDFYLGGNATP